MSDFEHDLLDILEQDAKFDPARAEVLRLQITNEIKQKKRRLLIWTWVWHAIAAVPLIFGLSRVKVANNFQAASEGIILAVAGLALLIVIKLWYWIVHSRLEIMREIKRLELRWTLAQSREQPPEKSAC